MKKVLFTATVDSHILHFHIPYLKWFKEQGYEVHVATNGNKEIPYCDVKHVVSFERKPFKANNLRAIKQLKKIINEEKFNIIHCHTPMGSVVTRIAAMKARKKYNTKVIYTAHGFHFFKGAPLINWMVFYPVEKWLSNYTDCLITINKEDYNLANNKFKAKQIELVNGVGVDKNKFNFEMSTEEKHDLRKKLGLKDDDFVMTIVGELNKNKNQIMAIETMRKLTKKDNKIKLLLVGTGELEEYYKNKVKEYDLEGNVIFAGYRKDIPKLLKISNCLLSISLREGLPVNVMEAKINLTPVIATKCRGNIDLIENQKDGLIIENNSEELEDAIFKIKKGFSIKSNDISKIEMQEVESRMFEIYKSMTKIKIAHILASNSYSGAENVAITIIREMQRKYENIECIYVSLEGEIRKTLEKNFIKFYPIKRLSIREINKLCKKEKIDIIHAHDFKASIISAKSRFKGKIISYIHQTPFFLKTWNIKSFLYFTTIKRYFKVVGVTNEIIDNCIFKKYIQKKYVTIYNCVDKKKIKELVKEGKCNKEYDIAFFGRLSKVKNPIRFLNIVSAIKKVIPDIKVVIIGDGELKYECMKFIKENQLEQNIELKGFCKNPFCIINYTKIIIMTSEWEGIPMSVLECIAMSKPVLNNGVGGLSEIFLNNSDLICTTDYEYIEKAEKLLLDSDFYNKCVNEINSNMNKFYNIDSFIDKVKNIYEI